MAIVLPNGRNQFFTTAGAPLAGGKVYTYAAGTSTPKATYTSAAATVANTNPVILDARGEAAIYWDGSYDVILRDANSVLIWGPESLGTSNLESDYLEPNFFPSSALGLSGSRTAYNATGVNDPDIGNNGTSMSLANCLFINNGFATGVGNATSDWKISCIKVVGETPDTTPQVSTDSRVNINSTVIARGAQHADAIRLNLTNYSTDGNGCTGVYGHGVSDVLANWTSSIHSEVRAGGGTNICFNAEAASYTTAGSLYGAVINNTTASAPATHPTTAAAAVAHPSATGIYIQGSVNVDPMGGWVYGMRWSTNSMRAAGVCIQFDATEVVEAFIKTNSASSSSTADIILQGDSSIGIILNGAYTNAALRIGDDQFIGLRTSNAIKMRYVTATSFFEITNSGTERFAVYLGGTPTIELNNTQVLTVRDTGWSAMTGTTNKATVYDTATVTLAQLAGRVMALQGVLTTHGLIGT